MPLPMGLRSAARALLAGGVATAMAQAAFAGEAPAVARGPFEADLARETARLAARAGRPEAVAPVAALSDLEESVPAAALEPLLRRAAGPGADPLVAAQ